jgi:hypothetical protein
MNRRHLITALGAYGAYGAYGALAQGAPAAARSNDAMPSSAVREAFAFGLIGDLPYFEIDEQNLTSLIEDMNADGLECVIHVGDIKTSMELCSDTLYARRKALLERSLHPLILLPGDNDWTDCHRTRSGGYDPRERLAALRKLFWSTPYALGRPEAMQRQASRPERQADYPENVRWRIGNVQFVALHVVGSSNGLNKYPGSRSEFELREAANRAWLSDTLSLALRSQADALVLAIHGNPGFQRTPAPGYGGFMQGLQELAQAFRQPILLLHGDSHTYRVDRPLRDANGYPVEHLTRIECYGAPMTQSWVRIAYDPLLPARFRVSAMHVRPRHMP